MFPDSLKFNSIFTSFSIGSLLTKQRDTMYFLGASFGGAILSFLLLPVFTRYLAVEEFGIIGFALALNSFVAPLFTLCLNSFYIREYNKELSEGKTPKNLLSSIMLFTGLWSIILLLLLFILVPAGFGLLQVKVAFLPVGIVLVTNLFQVPFIYYLLQLRLERKAKAYFFAFFFQSLICLLLPLAFVIWYEPTADSRLTGYTVAFLLTGLTSFFVLRKKLSLKFDPQIIRKGVRFSAPLVLYTLASLAFDFSDRYFIEHFNTLRVLGFYNVGFQFANLIYVFALAIYRAYEPSYYSLYYATEHKKLNRLFDLTNYVVWGVGISVFILLPFIVRLLTSGDYSDSVSMGRWLILATILQSVNMVYQTYYAIANKTFTLMAVSLFVLILFLVVGYYMSAIYGYMGTIYAKIIAQVIILVISYFSFYKQLKQSRSFIVSLVFTAGLFGLLYYL